MVQVLLQNLFSSHTPIGVLRQLISAFIPFTRAQRACPSLPDVVWIEHGLHRVLTPQVSGREHLQFLAQVQGQHIPRQTWFDAFQSPRRSVYAQMTNEKKSSQVEKLPREYRIQGAFREGES